MPRGGYRKGAGRKKEYNEPVKSVLIGLPKSVLNQLDDYAKDRNLSRPKAIALLLEQVQKNKSSKSDATAKLLKELKALKTDRSSN